LDQSTKKRTKKRLKIEFPELTKMADLANVLVGGIQIAESADEELFHQDDLINLLPYGVSVAPDLQNTFFFLKDKAQNLTLSVTVNPVEASLILAQLNLAPDMQLAQPHRAMAVLLSTLGVEIRQCVFVQTKGNRQLVRLYFTGSKSASSIKLYADQAMSLCIALRVPIYATVSFINKSKVVHAQGDGLAKNLIENRKMLLKNTTYLQ
jgi:hypothetical protein